MYTSFKSSSAAAALTSGVRAQRFFMKISGYSDLGLPIDEIISSELAEITILASPGELRKIASFLNSAAEAMEQLGSNYSHLHLSDKQDGFTNSPHFTVFNSELIE